MSNQSLEAVIEQMRVPPSKSMAKALEAAAEDDQVIAIALGTLTDDPLTAEHATALVLTEDKAILRVAEGSDSEYFDGNQVSLSLQRGVSLSTVFINTGYNDLSVTNIDADEAHDFCRTAANELGIDVAFGLVPHEEDEIREELARLKDMLTAGLITKDQYEQLRNKVLERLGYEPEEEEDEGPSTKKLVAIVAASVVALLAGALLLFGMLGGDDEDEEPAVEPTESETPDDGPATPEVAETEEQDEDLPAPTETATQTEEAAPPEEEEEEEPAPEQTQEEEAPQEEETEVPEAEEPGTSTDQYTDNLLNQDIMALIDEYFADNELDDSSAQFGNLSAEMIEVFTTSLDEDADAETVAYDLAEIIAEPEDLLDEPMHDVRVDVEDTVVTYDRSADEYNIED